MEKNRDLYRKLKSEEGATLSVALLLFLVCACVGAVILAAANTTAGRVSGIRDSGGIGRYAVNDAASMIRTEMNRMNGMKAVQSWTVHYTQDDYRQNADGSLTSGEITPDSGNKWLLELDDSSWTGDNAGWSYTITEEKTDQDGVKDSRAVDFRNYLSFNKDQKHEITQSGQTGADTFHLLRDIMAYAIYRNYWDSVVNPAGGQSSGGSSGEAEASADPWAGTAMGEIPWDQAVENAGDHSIATDDASPFEISLENEKDFPTVYAAFSMDQNFSLTIDLYTKDSDGSKANERELVFRADDANVTRSSSVTENSREDISDSSGDGDSLTNFRHHYTDERTVTAEIRWDEGTLQFPGGTS
jgi:hypothetical protein